MHALYRARRESSIQAVPVQALQVSGGEGLELDASQAGDYMHPNQPLITLESYRPYAALDGVIQPPLQILVHGDVARIQRLWYLVVILGPAAFSLAVVGVYMLLGGSWEVAAPPALRAEVPLLLLPLFLTILTVTDGLGEELAWRGFALPRLLTLHNALVASLILGVLWALWHLPLFWTEGYPLYQRPIWLLFVDLPAQAVIYTWIFQHTRGSVLLAALLHAASSLIPLPQATGSSDLTLPLLAVAAKWLLVVVLIIVLGPNLARGPRPEALPKT